MFKASIASLVFLIASIMGQSVVAQQTTTITITQQSKWAAVGRLVSGPFDNEEGCTATLVQPDLIATAAHCLAGLRDATPAQIAMHRFFAGLVDGNYVAVRTLAEVIFAEDFQVEPLNLANLPNDWSLARLAEPILSIDPLPVVAPPGVWETVAIVAYSNVHRTSPTISFGCPQNLINPQIMRVGCKVIGGNSGAPVIAGAETTPQLVGIVSAQSGDGALAIVPNAALLFLITE